MEQKPKIYAHCPAGCKWEVPHMSDFLKSAAYVEQYPDENGQFILELGKEYRIFADKDTEEGEFVDAPTLIYRKGGEESNIYFSFNVGISDPYADSFVFKLVHINAMGDNYEIIYELQGVRYSHTLYTVAYVSDYLIISNVNRVLLINSDATITAEKGEDGKDGANIVNTVFIGQDENGGNIYEQTFDNGVTARFVAPKGENGIASVVEENGKIVFSDVPENVINPDESLWENGSISFGNNFNDGISIRLRTIDYFKVEPKSTYTVTYGNPSYKVEIILYNANNVYSRTTDYVSNGQQIQTGEDESRIRCVIAQIDNVDIVPSDVVNMQISMTKDGQHDKYLSLRDNFKSQLKLMTFNVGQWYNGIQRCPDNLISTHKNLYKQLIAKYQPDVIFTQEAPQYMNEGNTEVAKDFFGNRYNFFEGTFDWLGKQFVTNYNIFDTTETAFSNERSYVKAYTYINGVKVALYNTHLSLTADLRAVQMNEILADMRTEEYVILGADTNVSTIGELQPFINAGFKLGNCGVLGELNTLAGGEGYAVVDNIIVSENITLCKAEVEGELFESLKDHRPFILTVEVAINKVDDPIEDGIYIRKLVVENGVKKYMWVKES